MNKLCENCHRYYAVMFCEHCHAAICSACGDVIENDPEDLSTWVILCNACDIEADYRPLSLLPKIEEIG